MSHLQSKGHAQLRPKLRLEVLESRLAMAGDIAGLYGTSTAMVADVNTHVHGARIGAVVQLDNTLQVLVEDGNGDVELWQKNADSDDLSRTLVMANTPTRFNRCCHAGIVGDRIYFAVERVWHQDAYGFSGNAEFWSTDGSSESLEFVSNLDEIDVQFSISVEIIDYDGRGFVLVRQHGPDGSSARFGILDQETGELTPYSRSLSVEMQSPVGDLVRFGDAFYFAGANYGAPQQFGLWMTNPVTKITEMVYAFNGSDRKGIGARGLTVFDGSIYFSADAGSGHELWVSDGTTNGTKLLKEIAPGVAESNPRGFTAIDGESEFLVEGGSSIQIDAGFLFRADDGTGDRVWLSDGTSEGTVKLAEEDPRQSLQFHSGVSELYDFDLRSRDAYPERLVDDLLYFRQSQPDSLWVTDATDEGTVELGSGLAIKGTYNEAPILVRGTEAYTYDPTAKELQSLISLPTHTAANGDSTPFAVTTTPDALYWITSHDGLLRRLDASTGETTTISSDDRRFFDPEFYGRLDTRMQRVGEKLFVFGPNGLSVIDTTTHVEHAIRPDMTDVWTSGIMRMTSSADQLFFSVLRTNGFDDPTIEVWKSDGTDAGTSQLAGPFSTSRNSWHPPTSQYMDGYVFFVGEDRRLWASSADDGESQYLGVNRVAAMTVLGDELLFLRSALRSRQNTSHEFELWKSDGTEEGTQLISTIISPFPQPLAQHIVTFGDMVIFASKGGLYQSDGTQAGTKLIRQFPAQPLRSGSSFFGNHSAEPLCCEAPLIDNLVAGEDRFFFTMDDRVHGNELWVSDGTAAGTMLAADIRPGLNSSSPDELAIHGNRLYFSAADGQHGRELWSLNFAPDSQTLDGDINASGEVDLEDFWILAENFGAASDKGLLKGDVDENGTVDFTDFLILAHNFGHRGA